MKQSILVPHWGKLQLKCTGSLMSKPEYRYQQHCSRRRSSGKWKWARQSHQSNAWSVKFIVQWSAQQSLKEVAVHALQTKTDLPGKKSAVLELPQEVSDEEATQHEAHREQRCIGVGRVNSVDDYRSVASSVVVHDRLFHSWVPGIFNCGIHMVVVQDHRMGLENLKRRITGMKNEFTL